MPLSLGEGLEQDYNECGTGQGRRWKLNTAVSHSWKAGAVCLESMLFPMFCIPRELAVVV